MRRSPILTVFLMVCSAAAAVAQAPVRNGGFGIEAQLDGWQAGAPAFRFADDDGLGAPGCILFTGPAPAKSAGPSQEIAVAPNTEYVLAAALKSDGQTAPSVRVRRADGSDVVAGAAGRPAAWKRVLVRFNSGANERLTVVCVGSDEDAPEGARAWFDDVAVLLPAQVPAGQAVEGGFVPAPPGENIARGCPVAFDRAPNYGYSTDPGDATQLTDGEYSAGYFWVQKSTVGWSNVSPVILTLDLGTVQPVAGMSFSTAAGVANVGWPASLFVAVSDDGKEWRYAGDVVTLAAPNGLPTSERYATFRFVTDRLQTRARFLRLAVLPSGSYTFCDEIEVYRGPDALLAQAARGEVVNDTRELVRRFSTRSGIVARLTLDLAEARAAVGAANLPAARKDALLARLAAIEREIPALPEPDLATFRAVLPLNDLHARLYAVNGALLRARGLPSLVAWKKGRYDFLSPTDAPAPSPPGGRGVGGEGATPTLTVEMMRGEFRADAFLLTNATEQPMQARLRVVGPGAPHPAWLHVSSVPWTDTNRRVPVAAALPDAEYANGSFRVTIPAGMTRKVWVTVDSAQIPETMRALDYRLVVEPGAPARPVQALLQVRVSPLRMGRPRLSLGMWDYTDAGGAYGITGRNRDAAIALMRSHFVDTPWAQSRVLPRPAADAFDAAGNLKAPLAFDAFDAWVKLWPGARRYFVFASVGSSFAGAAMGSPEFDARVATWVRALAQHARDVGLQPRQIGILLVDEPHSDAQDEQIAAWARAIRAANTGILLFQDPTWERPDQTKVQEAITLADIVCPNIPLFYRGGPDVARYFEERRAAGQQMWFYQCSGPSRLFDPYRYHRLQAWHAFRHGAVGMGFWAFGDTGEAESSWNEYATARTPYTPAFLGVDDATDGIHWQAVREGIEDYEYLAMLRDAAGETADGALGAQAVALLREAPAAVLGDYSPDYDWKKPADHAAADTYRVKVLRLLEKMRGQ